jgi:hypothetical protein
MAEVRVLASMRSLRLKCVLLPNIGSHDIPEAPGVYVVQWVERDDRQLVPRRIPRILNIDNAGILYIGSAEELHGRLKILKSSISRVFEAYRGGSLFNEDLLKRIEHTAAETIIYTNLVETLGSEDNLQVCYKVFNDEKDAELQEVLMLYRYTRCYGEPPPLNLGVGREHIGGIRRKEHMLDPDLASLLC